MKVEFDDVVVVASCRIGTEDARRKNGGEDKTKPSRELRILLPLLLLSLLCPLGSISRKSMGYHNFPTQLILHARESSVGLLLVWAQGF